MTDSYREKPLACPACGDLLEARVLSGATVDTCVKCRGLWVDWYDGDLLSIVNETAPLSFRSPVEINRALAKCPRCTQPLMPESFAGTIVLLRCSDCAGCFVPRASFTPLLELDLPAHSRHGADLAKQTGFARLLAAIGRLFGAEPTLKIDVSPEN
jgi:Zn-finger nucleic acid-binding protein